MKKLFSTIIILFLTLFFSCSNPDENELNEIEELKVEMKGIPDYLSNLSIFLTSCTTKTKIFKSGAGQIPVAPGNTESAGFIHK